MSASDLNDLETRIEKLEVKMRTHDGQIDDIEAAFFGTDRDPERQERLRRVGILERIDETNRLLRKIAGEIESLKVKEETAE